MTPKPNLLPPNSALRAAVDYIRDQATYPIEEVALGAGLGLFAGIAGRAYQTPGRMAGLNLYIMVAAPTGMGKDAGRQGMYSLLDAVVRGENPHAAPNMPSAREFIGPARFASVPAVMRHLEKVRSFVSIMTEGGKEFSRMTDPRASSHDRDVATKWLDIYGSSSFGGVVGGTAYANASDNIGDVVRPAVTIYAEGTQKTVYANYTDNCVSDGLWPRFMMLDRNENDWPQINEYPQYEPSPELVQYLTALCERSHTLNQQDQVVQVGAADDARDALAAYEKETRRIMETCGDDVVRALWTRSALRAKKLASLVAVGVHFDMPTVTLEHALWAINLERYTVGVVIGRVSRGEVGGDENNELRQAEELKRTVVNYLVAEYHELSNAGRVTRSMHAAHIIPWSYLLSGVGRRAAFKHGKPNPVAALERTVRSFIDAGWFVEVDQATKQAHGKSGKAYAVTNAQYFLDRPDAEESKPTNPQFFTE
ncbi:hypothetical protein [Rhodophyticola porphyridii]|uniref:DUF3987 domain-containing protein n=1 Tax=Rhodophyticola porphyridii TaxID=1852017 RepID=A0A3L9Y3F3_9RHOB|nr:hypothetical protein [Rhodophyticola porphyridii]RMA40833.1 hypothetical protein D9R08_16830 [Rhodophyticola porphyridii]